MALLNSKRKSSENVKEPNANKSVSKRHRSGSNLGNDYKGKSTFYMVLKENGLYMKNGSTQNQLTVDQTVFLKNIERSLKSNDDNESLVNDIVMGFQEYCEDEERFHHCFLPTVLSNDCGSTLREGNQDSAVRLLLKVDQLQMPMMDYLLEKLVDYRDDNNCMVINGSKINLPRLMLSQFRWLDKIVDSKQLARKILDLVVVTPISIQRELITSLPEIIDDAEQNEVALTLKELLLKDKNLTVSILDALGNLNVKAELASDIRGAILPLLPSTDVDNVPILIKFMLESVPVNDMIEIVSKIRQNLDLHTLVAPACSSTPNTSRQSNFDGQSERGHELLVLDTIKSQILFQKSVCDAWIRVIEDVTNPTDQKVLDVFLIFILYETNKKKAIESLVRNKIRSSCFSEGLLQTTFHSHSRVIVEYFPTVLALAEALLRSLEPSINYIACLMYKLSFVAFDCYGRQELIGNLVSHIGSGIPGEMDSSLDILASLAEQNQSRLEPFVIIIRGILDYLDNMTINQIRKLYALLGRLAFCNYRETSLIRDDLHIVIRKQLSKTDLKYKRMGIIGAVMIIKSLSSPSLCGNDGGASISLNESEDFSDNMFKDVKNLHQLVHSSSSHIPEAMALFMDELADIINKGSVNSKVENLISEKISEEFLNNFVVDLDINISNAKSILPMEKLYSLDDENEGSIAINLLPLIENDAKKIPGSVNISLSPVCLAPHFRLLCMCEKKKNNSNLEQIDALLGCPLLTCQEETVNKLKSLSVEEKNTFCTALFYTINWFRELINGFSCEKDPEMKVKIISRLGNITDLQDLLVKALLCCPNYQPPQALFDCDVSAVSSLSTAKSGKNTKKGKGQKVKGKSGKRKAKEIEDKDDSDDDSLNQHATTTQESQTSQMKNSDSKAMETDDLSLDRDILLKYRCFFREFDLSVFKILSSGLVTNTSLDADNLHAPTDIQLKPPQLELLLSDLNLKLGHSLIGTKLPRKSFLNVKSDKNNGYSHLDQYKVDEIVNEATKILPSLCQHLQNIQRFFQVENSESDGMGDVSESRSPDTQQLASCYHLLMQLLLTIYSWNGFMSKEGRPVMKRAMIATVTHFEPAAISQKSSHEIFKICFVYIENFGTNVPTLSTAVNVLKLLSVIQERSNIAAFKARICAHAEGFMKRKWLTADAQLDKGAKFNENLQTVITIYFKSSEDGLERVEDIATKGMEEIIQVDKFHSSSTYPTLHLSSYPVYYRAILVQLLELSKQIQPGTKMDSHDEKLAKLLTWNRIVRVFQIMVKLIKTFDSRSNLMTVLKYGRGVVDVFLRLGMPLLDHMFRNHHADIQSLLKQLQISTRSLHHICGHSKIVKDVALTNQVPMVKRTLEAFVYRVKAMLTLNKCLDAFWMGNLKNRDLKGEEILSQVPITQESQDNDNNDSDDQEAEVPDDEVSDVDDDVHDEPAGAPLNSFSECF